MSDKTHKIIVKKTINGGRIPHYSIKDKSLQEINIIIKSSKSNTKSRTK